MRKHLDPSLCFSKQQPAQLKKFQTEVWLCVVMCDTLKSLTDAVQMASKFPALNDYEEMWPLDCIIISSLKYCASQNKSSSMKKTVESMQNTVAQTATLTTHSAT